MGSPVLPHLGSHPLPGWWLCDGTAAGSPKARSAPPQHSSDLPPSEVLQARAGELHWDSALPCPFQPGAPRQGAEVTRFPPGLAGARCTLAVAVASPTSEPQSPHL